MRITFVLPALSRVPIGGYRVVYEYANQLFARGHNVTVVHARRVLADALPPPLSLSRRLRLDASYVRERLLPPKIRWQAVDGGVKLRVVPDPSERYLPDADAIFATWWPTAEYISKCSPSKGEKFYLVQDFAPWQGPKDRLDATWRLPLHKVTDSRWLYEQVCEAEGSSANTINIPIGIDHQKFRLIADIEARPKRVTMYFGTVGYKTPEVGVRALEIVKQHYPSVIVGFFGQRVERPAGIPSWASYRGHVPGEELLGIYNGSSIFVCCSAAEGFGLPPAEAMACGCAVASTDCGGVREFAEHGLTALLSPPGNPEELAKNILRLLEDEGLRVRLAREGNKRIRAFRWERCADLLEGFIKARITRDCTGSGRAGLLTGGLTGREAN